jgi:hypothetical protein
LYRKAPQRRSRLAAEEAPAAKPTWEEKKRLYGEQKRLEQELGAYEHGYIPEEGLSGVGVDDFMNEAFESGMDLSEALLARRQKFGYQEGGQVRGYQQGGKIENGKKPKKTLDQLLLELQLMEMHGSDKDKIPKGSPLEPVFSAMGKYPHHPKYLIDGEWVSGNPDMDDSTMMNAPMRMMFYTPDKGWVGMETILGYDEYQSYKNIDKQSLKKEIGFKSPKSGNNYQEGGQVYQGPRNEPSEADFGRQVNPFTGEEMNIAEDKKRMALQMLKSLGVGKGQRIDSDAMDSLMGMSDDRRIIPPLPPDEYVMRQENGGMYMSKQQVPKLSPAYMVSFGMETPLSKRQRSLLQRRAINPESMSPQLHGLLGKVLLQRLENEPE